MPDLDEFGIPIKKVELDEFGIPIKKKDGGVVSQKPTQLQSSSKNILAQRPEELPLGVPKVGAAGIDRLFSAASEAKSKLDQAVSSRDDIYADIIKENRLKQLDTESRAGLSDMVNPALQSARKGIITQIPVTPKEIQSQKDVAITNPNAYRDVLKRAAKKDPEIAKNAYLVDAEQRAIEKPEAAEKILQNADKIANGELNYSVGNGVLQKPEGAFVSLYRGLQERNKQVEDYDFLTKTLNDDAIIAQLEDDRTRIDPDEPQPTPSGALAEFGMMTGMEGKAIAKSALAGLATGLIPGGQAAAPYVAAFVSSPEYYQRGYSTSLRAAYNEFRQRGDSEYEALQKAREQAETDANLSAAEGLASGFIGAKIGFKPTEFKVGSGFNNALKNTLVASKNFVTENLVEGGTDAAIAGGLQVAKNISAIEAGLDRGVFDDLGATVAGEVAFTTTLGAVIKAGKIVVNPKDLNTLVTGLARQPKEVVDAKIGELVVNGFADPQEAADAGKLIDEARKIDSQIPSTVQDEDTRVVIGEKIKEREALKAELATANEAFHKDIKDKIQNIDNEILNYATTESSKPVQEGAAESNIGEPTGVVQGQREGGTGEGIQGEATLPKADVGDSNLGGEAKITPDQISVSNDPTDFAAQMQSAQSSLGKAGMSVSPYTQEAYDEVASEGGKFLRAADNKVLALLKPSGEMVSLVKDATVKAKGAAQAMISKMKDMGGLFMDNYDIYLTPIYEKAGYKVVARVPFDEQYAPEGWNEEDSPLKNKPDVVFMVRNDIPAQEQTFTEYGDAQNYVKGIVDSAVSSGIAKTPSQMDIETELTQELIKEPVAKVQQSLKSAGITVDLIADPAEFDRQVQQLGGQAGMEGVFLADDGKVLLNEQKLKEGTNAGRIIFHEATHPIINIIRNTKPDLYKRVVAGINAASDNPAIQQAKAWVESNKNVYDTDVKKEDETLVETIAMVGDGTLDLNTIETGFKQALIEVINTIARALGFKPVLNDTDVAAFKKLAAQIADVLTSGRDIAEFVGKENVKEYGVPVGIPTQPKAPEKYGTKVKHDGGQYKLSFVKPSDIIDIKSLVEDIVSNKQKAWFWTADQLGRGMYFDNVINGEHYLDAGPSFALDPKNRAKGIIWATGKGKKWVKDKIANSDYIFIMSGSPQKSKLFNKRVAEITFNRVKKAVGEEGAWDKFKSEVLSVSKIGKINKILNKYNSFEDLLASPDRKELLIQFDAQKGKKSTPLKGLLDKYGVLIDYNDLRDGFYRENGFELNDVMLVLKPTGFGGKSEHSTYENDILGEVVGVPDRKVNSYDLMTDEFKKKYTEGMSRTEQSQAVAPYGVGIRDIQASAGNREIINGFYSPIQKRVNEFKQPKASVQKWKEIVGTKTDEAVFSGLADWLGGMKPDRQLTKEEVNNFMSENRIEINEVMKGDEKFSFSDEKLKEMDALLEEEGFLEFDTIEQVRGQIREEEDFAKNWKVQNPRLVDLINEYRNSVSDFREVATKYSQYQLPGGENYKEILVTLPGKDQFKSSHFDETNIITHLRMNTRTDVDGNKVLFLEEVQSDWGQKGKKEGFESKEKDAEFQKLKDNLEYASERLYEIENKLDEDYRIKRRDRDESRSELRKRDSDFNKLAMEYYPAEQAELEARRAYDKFQIENRGDVPTAPYVTNTNAWVKLGLKVALKEAIRQGADRISWTTGQQQNERYDLSKQVDEITYSKYNDGTYQFSGSKNDVQLFNYQRIPKDKIEDYVGKDVAKRMIDNEGEVLSYGNKEENTYNELGRVLKGSNLTVGGKGMKDFYGDAQNVGIVGKVAKALVKELTGKEGEIAVSKISTPQLPKDISVGEIQAAGGVDAVKAKQMSDQPAIDITPELVQAVEGGLPQFSAGNRPENNQNFKLAAFVMRKKAEGATDGEIAIGIASVTGMKPEDIKTIIDNPEQFIRDSFPSMSKLQQDNLIQKAKIQDIYRGRQFGKPIDKPFMGLEVPQEMVDDYLDKTGRADKTVKDWAKDFKRKWLDPAKGLPDWTLAIKDFATGAKNIEVARAANTIQRLKEVAKQIGFKDWDAFSDALVAAKDVQRFIPDETGVVPFDVYRAAANRTFATPDDKLPALVPDAIKKLPDEIIPFAYAMRGQIDNLTRDLIGSGYVTPEQAVVLEKNLGAYTNRAYKMFSERGYVPEKKVYNAAVKFLAEQKMPAIANDNVGVLTDKQIVEKAMEEAKKDVEIYLSKKKNPYFGSKSDRRDTGILQERKDIPEPIRNLMGQYTDPGTVFIMTVAKQAALKSTSQYLNKLRTMGMGTLFFEREDPSRPVAEYTVEIAPKGSESMNPLGGLLTTKEIAEALDMVDPTYNDLTETWMKLVGMVRWGKTVGSVATQFKNFESNGGFAVLNGYMLSGENTQAFKAAAKYVKGQYSKGEIDAITDKVIRLNLVGQSVGMRELKEMLGSGDVHDIAVDIALNPESKWGKKVAKRVDVLGAANKLYRLGDDFWKVYAYMVEREQIADARFNGAKYDSLTKQQQEQVDIESSERVKNTWPTYDRVVEGAKFVSKRAPIFGNFISFQAESLRALTNSIKLAKQDLSDPQMRHLGVRRMAGISAYVGLRSAITIGLAKMAGFAAAGILGSMFGDDEEERNKRAIREALPPFMRTGDLAVTQGDKPHQYTVVNMSSLDPYGVVPNSLNAFTEGREGIFGRTMEPGILAAGAELFSGFLEPEMTFETMWSVINNKDPKTGEQLVMETDTDLQASAKVAAKIWDQLEPSTVSMIQRLYERDNKEAELLALGGARPYDVDLHKSFGFVLSRFGKDIDAINKEYNRIKYDDKMTEQEKEAAEKVAEDKKAFAISKVSQIYRDFINIGADPKVLDELINQKSAVKVTGYDKNTKKSIKTGKISKEKLFK